MCESEPEQLFLEPDNPVPGQNYACISFLSPEEVIKSKEIYMFHRYKKKKMGEFEQHIDKIMKNATDELKTRISKDLKERLKLELQYTYDQFKENYDNFLYKFSDELQDEFNKKVNYQTNIRGVKVRGVYETLQEAEFRAKHLQKRDRSFHVFVGSVGKWLPWDPCADKIEKEEYLEEELNTLIKEYKKNNENKDLFYEQQKQDKINAHNEELKRHKLEMEKQEEENKKNMKNIEEHLDSNDPWLERQKSISGEKETDTQDNSTDNTE